MTSMKFRSFLLTQLCFNSCSLFYSNYPLHVSVKRKSSCAKNTSQNIMISMKLRSFRLTQLCFISCFLFYSILSATCFVLRTILKCKYIHHKMSGLAWGSGVSVQRNSSSIIVRYFIQVIPYIFRSYDHLQVHIFIYIHHKISWLAWGSCVPSNATLLQ
jgi:Zn-dependent M16 (insulinase) family peptidase